MIEFGIISALTLAMLLGLLSLISVLVGQRMPQIVEALRPATVRGVSPALHYAA